MIKKENQRVRLTKRLLRESLLGLMEKKEIDKISISELCARAGVNRTTFYNHYDSQYDILREIGRDFAMQIASFGKAHNEASGWALDRQVTEICDYLKLHRKEAVMIFRNFDAESDIMKELFHQRILNQSQYVQFASQYDDETRQMLDTFLTHGIYGLIRRWLTEDMNKSSDEIGRLALNIAQNGWMRKPAHM